MAEFEFIFINIGKILLQVKDCLIVRFKNLRNFMKKIKFLFGSIAFGVSLLLCGENVFAQTDVISSVNFENREVGAYTNAFAKEDFKKGEGSSWYAMEQNGGQNAKIVEDDSLHGKVLQLKYPAGCLGPSGTGGAVPCAGQVSQPLVKVADTMWTAYDVKFEEGFQFVLGGKLPGLCGGECYSGGNKPTTGDGWSARVMWREGGGAVQYMYFVDQAGMYGDDMLWNLGGKIPQKKFIPGKWHRLVTKITLNTVTTEGNGDKNGRVQSWFDGELSVDVDTLRLRDFANQHIDRFYISTFHGGNASNWSPTQDVFARFDNIVVATDSIPVLLGSGEMPENPNPSPEYKDTTTAIGGVAKDYGNGVLKESAPIGIYKIDGTSKGRKIYPAGTPINKLPNGKSIKVIH